MFSKPIPPCLFPASMHTELLTSVEHSPVCSVFAHRCTQNACVLPDGHVSPCLSMLGVRRPLADFADREQLADFCESAVLPLLDRAVFPQCLHCFLRARRLCQGLCLGHKRD